MKIVKVRITRGGVGQAQMVYPDRYIAEEVDRRGAGPLNVNGAAAYSGGIGRGDAEEFCLIVLDDQIAEEYESSGPDMEIVSAADADALMEQWRIDQGNPAEVVRDVNRIQAIIAKQGAGITLTAEDLEALDVDSPVPGINKALRSVLETFGDRLTS